MSLGSLGQALEHRAIDESGDGTDNEPGLLVTAGYYYRHACMRLGGLGTDLISAQCWFLCGIFEMYRLNPRLAWSHFARASSLTYLIISTRQTISDDHLRLYLSCQKSERYAGLGRARLSSKADILLAIYVLSCSCHLPHCLPYPCRNRTLSHLAEA